MESPLVSIFNSIEESVAKIKGNSFRDTHATITLIEQAQNLLAAIKERSSKEELKKENPRKRKLDETSPNDEDEPDKKKSKLDLPLIPCAARRAYEIFLQEKRDEFTVANPKASIHQRLTARKNMWNSMSYEEKQVYEQKAKQDSERYQREIAEYIAEGGILREKTPLKLDSVSDESSSEEESEDNDKKPNSVLTTIRRRKDPNAPKRAISAFMFFNAEVRPTFPAEMSMKEKIMTIARQWKSLSDEAKMPYVQRAALDKERFNRELQEYNQRLVAEEKNNNTKTGNKRKADLESDDDNEDGSGSESNSSKDESSEESSEDQPKKPKKTKNAYLLFCDEVRPTLPADMLFSEKVKLLSERFKTLPDEQKQPYYQRAALEKERHDRELREYNERINAKEQSKKKSTRSGRNTKPEKKLGGNRKSTRGRKKLKDDAEEPPALLEDEENEKPTRKLLRGRKSLSPKKK